VGGKGAKSDLVYIVNIKTSAGMDKGKGLEAKGWRFHKEEGNVRGVRGSGSEKRYRE